MACFHGRGLQKYRENKCRIQILCESQCWVNYGACFHSDCAKHRNENINLGKSDIANVSQIQTELGISKVGIADIYTFI